MNKTTPHFVPVLSDRRFKLGEGPFYDRARRTLYWVDIIAREAWSLDIASSKTRVWRFDQPVSAVVPRVKGGLLVAKAHGLVFLDPETGKEQSFAAPEGDVSGNRSNEARVDPQGRFWLGTMQNNIGPNEEDLPITHSSGHSIASCPMVPSCGWSKPWASLRRRRSQDALCDFGVFRSGRRCQ